jgi:hypothetical protein
MLVPGKLTADHQGGVYQRVDSCGGGSDKGHCVGCSLSNGDSDKDKKAVAVIALAGIE